MKMKDKLEFLTAFIPFLEAYPVWVKFIVAIWILLTAIMIIAFIFAPKIKPNSKLVSYEFKITPETRKIDTKIDVKMGEYITGEIDLSNPFHVNTTKNFPWMPEFINRYKNQGKWIGPIKYFSPSGIETYDANGHQINLENPDVVLKTWAAIYMQIGKTKYRIEKLSIKDSLINNPPETKMHPLLIEEPGRIYIYANPHPYIEGTEGEILVRINVNQ